MHKEAGATTNGQCDTADEVKGGSNAARLAVAAGRRGAPSSRFPRFLVLHALFPSCLPSLTKVSQQLDLSQDALGVDQVLEDAGDALDGHLQVVEVEVEVGQGGRGNNDARGEGRACGQGAGLA